MSHDANRCYFQWDIYNPFVPWQKLEATFYHGSPTPTQWKVTLQPMDRGRNYWNYSFFLEYDERYHRTAILADKFVVFINLNEDLIADREANNYHFRSSNRFKYHFQEKVVMHPQMEPHHLVIRIELSLPGRARGNPGRNAGDLRGLSRDMTKLLELQQYTNMDLMAKNDTVPFRAHSYIVDARWNNFFTKHSFDINNPNTVETNIPRFLLRDILTYMYSGQLRPNLTDWRHGFYGADLFRVIEDYELYHLYKVFVKSDLLQNRVTRNRVLLNSCRFPLDIVHGRPVNRDSRTWLVDQNYGYKLIFQIRVGNEAGNWLSYSLQSKSPGRVYAQVNLEVVKSVEGNAFRRVASFDGRDYTIEPCATVESGPVLFLGCPETFGYSDGTETKYSIRCFLNVVYGTNVEWLQSLDDETRQHDWDIFCVLSDHMSNLYEQRIHSDMLIVSDPLFPGDDVIAERIHKGIFAARLPRWWAGLQNGRPANVVPNEAISTLSRSTLPIVLDYIYTGKELVGARCFRDEIGDFAVQTGFTSLINFLNRFSFMFG